uniref:Uncharacterized protein n=1 Tax=Anguilla anguilla TaxID=7936 RepID=A0A0E9VED6_ANGAN
MEMEKRWLSSLLFMCIFSLYCASADNGGVKKLKDAVCNGDHFSNFKSGKLYEQEMCD